MGQQSGETISRVEFCLLIVGGAEGIRTPDPLTASQVRYQLRHSPLPLRSYTTTNQSRAGGPPSTYPAMAFSSQPESFRSIFLPPIATVGVPNWPSVCSAAVELACSVSDVISPALVAPFTHPAKSPCAPRSVPSAISSASVRPALRSAGWESNSCLWYAGKMPAATEQSAALAARVE